MHRATTLERIRGMELSKLITNNEILEDPSDAECEHQLELDGTRNSNAWTMDDQYKSVHLNTCT